jgi:hypothetical protein
MRAAALIDSRRLLRRSCRLVADANGFSSAAHDHGAGSRRKWEWPGSISRGPAAVTPRTPDTSQEGPTVRIYLAPAKNQQRAV